MTLAPSLNIMKLRAIDKADIAPRALQLELMF